MVKASVIMGIYNAKAIEKYLNEAIESMLEQDFVDFEYIICDDGSSDGTYETLQKIKEKDNRIILIRNSENKGLAESLNNCLKIARGEYIVRMDADDISLKNRLWKQIEFLEINSQYDMVGCQAKLIDENGVWGKRRMPEIPKEENFLFGSPFIHPTVIFRKKMLDELGGYKVSKDTRRAEDYELFMRAYSLKYVGYNLQESLLCFREDERAYSRRKYKYRIQEAKIRLDGFKRLGLLPKGYIYVLKPLIVGLIPQKILRYMRNEKE